MLQCLRELSVARSPYDDLVAECTERVWTCQGCEKGRWSALQEIKKIRKQKRAARVKFGGNELCMKGVNLQTILSYSSNNIHVLAFLWPSSAKEKVVINVAGGRGGGGQRPGAT